MPGYNQRYIRAASSARIHETLNVIIIYRHFMKYLANDTAYQRDNSKHHRVVFAKFWGRPSPGNDSVQELGSG